MSFLFVLWHSTLRTAAFQLNSWCYSIGTRCNRNRKRGFIHSSTRSLSALNCVGSEHESRETFLTRASTITSWPSPRAARGQVIHVFIKHLWKFPISATLNTFSTRSDVIILSRSRKYRHEGIFIGYSIKLKVRVRH